MARRSVRTIVRIGPKVHRAEHEDLLSALLALREQLDSVQPTTETKSLFKREFAPVAQVLARGEVRAANGGRAGIDVRGDGSSEAWTGRVRRQVVDPEPGEDTYAALARVLGG